MIKSDEDDEFERIERENSMKGQPYIYESKREWIKLTNEEIDKAWRSVDYTVPWEQHRIDIARAIESKIKELNS
jgi:hypothetical protein